MRTGTYLGELVKVYRDEDYDQMLEDESNDADLKAEKEEEYARHHKQEDNYPLSPSNSNDNGLGVPLDDMKLVELDRVPSCNQGAPGNTDPLRTSKGTKRE